ARAQQAITSKLRGRLCFRQCGGHSVAVAGVAAKRTAALRDFGDLHVQDPLEHHPEKWKPVFGKDNAPTIRVETDDAWKNCKLALVVPARNAAPDGAKATGPRPGPIEAPRVFARIFQFMRGVHVCHAANTD